MSVDRSGEIIPAGIAPSKITSTQNAFDRIHRGTSFILAIDTLIIVIFFSGMVVNALIGSSLENFSQYFIILPGIAGGLIWTAYRRTNRWAYWPSAGIIALASLFFGLLTLYDIWKFIQGDFGSLIMALLLGWATFGSIRRVRYHFHPGYKAAYLSEFDSSDDEIELEEGEMLAACSSCFAVLAIRPNMLSADDRCPHCDNRLVSNRTASKYNEEE